MELPTEQDLLSVDGCCIREPQSKEAVYRSFCASVVPGLIKYFAKLFKEKTEYKKIIGIFYGYSDCPNMEYQIASSAYGYESVWRDENIDMLFSPAAYSYGDDCRELGGASSYQYLVDSVAQNGNLYLHEIYHRTHLSCFPNENGVVMHTVYDDAFATVEVLRRELCATLCKGGSLWWFDFYGNYYACPELEEEIKKQTGIVGELVKKEHRSVSRIAVFADASSFGLLKEKLNLTVDFVRKNRNNLHKCGAPFDYFNLSDIMRIDLSQYKMLVFLYAPVLTDEVRKTIESSDCLKVYIHLPGVASGAKFDIEEAGKLCKMSLSQKEKYEYALFNGKKYGFHTEVFPILKVVDETAEVLSKYENGDICAAISGNNVYIGVSDIPSAMWRKLCEKAVVHLYTEKEIPVYADSRFISCQFPNEGRDKLYLEQDGEYVELFSGKTSVCQNGVLEFEHYAHQMMLFVPKSPK